MPSISPPRTPTQQARSVRVLVVGDPYLPVNVFTDALAALDPPVQITSMQIDRADAEPPRTESELRLREYAGDPAAVVAALPGHEVLVVHGAPVSAEALAVPGLRLVCCARGGPVNVDVDAATAAGIAVVNSPGKNARAVAELTVAFTLLLLRRVPPAALQLRSGAPLADSVFEGQEYFGRELAGATIGLIGLGYVGRAVAALTAGLGLTVLAYDPMPAAETPLEVERCGLADLLARSDVVSLHARATPQNQHLVDNSFLAQMRPGAALINTARESLVDESALVAALRSGQLSGAALDVVEHPSPGVRQVLLDEPNVIVTPHIGGATAETLRRGAEMVTEAIDAFARDAALPYLVNPEVRAVELGVG
jgi:D-3-phosphoglycerate dehydrogenase